MHLPARARSTGKLAASVLVAACAAALVAACASTADSGEIVPASALSGGSTTVFDTSRDAFSLSARNLSDDERDRYGLGKSLFQRAWVRAPASTTGDGLGPTYAATACTSCHTRGGRGDVPHEAGDRAIGLVVKLASGETMSGAKVPEPSYGFGLQPFAIEGVPAEGALDFAFDEVDLRVSESLSLKARKYRISPRALAFGPFVQNTHVSLRLAPQVVGLGLLEAVSEDDVKSRVDADDRDGDGVRGVASEVSDLATGERKLGRFGWKASFATVTDVAAAAFREDIGITSALFSEENCPGPQSACRAAPNGGAPELGGEKLAEVAFFARSVAVPARRLTDDRDALFGERVFREVGCATCHVPELRTTSNALPALAAQTFAPYTDLLLHDLGDELADVTPFPSHDARLFRTPPLWGLGLHSTVNGHDALLHDGRARDVTEAIAWHGGEAARSRRAFFERSSEDRVKMLRFLGSL